MEKLLRGIVDFRENQLHAYAETFAKLAHGQSPDALFIACSDSRVVPHLFASTDPGELFVMQNVGNLMPAAFASGHSLADESEAAAVEFAIGALKVDDIVVCGHSNCGAMKAVMTGQVPPGMPNLEAWLQHAEPALDRLREKGPFDPTLPPVDQLSQWNVLLQLEHLHTYPIVEEAVQNGKLRLSAFWFDVGTGKVFTFDETASRFLPIEGEFAAQLIDRYSKHFAR